MALGAAIEAETEDEEENERRFFEMAVEMDRPELMEIAESCPAVEAVARLCPSFGLPPEQAERWVAESDEFLATARPAAGGSARAAGHGLTARVVGSGPSSWRADRLPLPPCGRGRRRLRLQVRRAARLEYTCRGLARALATNPFRLAGGWHPARPL